jgi:hypothetical protein
VVRRLALVLSVCLLAGCGSSKHASSPTTTALNSLRLCLHHQGYAASPESPSVRRTAPARFQFFAIWNLLNPNRVALAMTFSRTQAGAKAANVWTQKTNDKIGKGKFHAPVVRFGRINVLWTTEPDPADTKAIYGCVRSSPLA